jgi:uncharacterized protein
MDATAMGCKSARGVGLAVMLLAATACSTACSTATRDTPGAATRDAPGQANSARSATAAPGPASGDVQRYSDDALPRAVGHVNDFAGVLPDSTKRMLEGTLRRLRATTQGDVVIVTFADHAGFKVEEIARRIGNEWGIGASSGPARNAGTVVLLIPRETSSDDRGHCRIELGEGATAFISDSVATSICVAATPSFRAGDYGEGLRLIALDLVRRYTERFRPPR